MFYERGKRVTVTENITFVCLQQNSTDSFNRNMCETLKSFTLVPSSGEIMNDTEHRAHQSTVLANITLHGCFLPPLFVEKLFQSFAGKVSMKLEAFCLVKVKQIIFMN